jgi:hypothetical protein
MPQPESRDGARRRLSEAQEAIRALGGALVGASGTLELSLVRTLERPLSLVAWVEARAQSVSARLVIKVPGPRADQDPRMLQKSQRRYQEEDANARRLGGLFHATSGLSVVRPVACFPEIPALATVAVAGESLRDRISRDGRWPARPARLAELAEATRQAGRWLRVMQDGTIVPGAQVSIEEMAAYADVRLKRLMTYGSQGLNEATRGRVLRVYEGVARRADRLDRTVCGVHGDLALSNVVWGDGGITVIDISAYREGSRYLDPTRIHHQLGLYRTKPLFTEDTIARLRDAFWDGYGLRPDPDDRMLLLHMAQHTLTHWWGRLKAAPGGPFESAYNFWVRRGHRETLDRVIARLETLERHDARD